MIKPNKMKVPLFMNILRIFLTCTLIVNTTHVDAMKRSTRSATANRTTLKWDMIPNEIITKIAAVCTPETRNRFMYVSKRFNDLVSKKNPSILFEDQIKLSKEDMCNYLLFGCEKNNYCLIQNLLTLCSDTNNKKNTDIVMRYAIDKNNLKLINFLLTHVNNDHKTMGLFHAIKNNRIDAIQTILTDSTLDVNHKDRDGSAPLHYAAGKPCIAQKLTFNNPDIAFAWNTLAHKNNIQEKKTAMVKLLIAHHNIQIDAQDNDENSPLYYAEQQGYTDIVNLLRNK